MTSRMAGAAPTRCGPAEAPTDSSGGQGDDVLHALANDDQLDGLDCGPGQDVAWLNQAERGLYRIANCEVVKIVVKV